ESLLSLALVRYLFEANTLWNLGMESWDGILGRNLGMESWRVDFLNYFQQCFEGTCLSTLSLFEYA
ncbi:MAG: hypothetical protein AAGM27_03735, partial [Cyanobacteria bacterium J06554_3]